MASNFFKCVVFFLLNNYTKSMKVQRLERIISNRGIGSRKEVSKLFKAGRIEIKGEGVILNGSKRYPMDIPVYIDGQLIEATPLAIVFNKPYGMHSVMDDPWGRGNLGDLSFEHPVLKSLHPVGRLDADTTGLLLFSKEGHLTQKLLSPKTGIEREYEAVVINKVNEDVLRDRLAQGVETTEGIIKANLLSVENDYIFIPPVAVKSNIEKEDYKYEEEECEEEDIYDCDDGSKSRILLTVTEGKYRMVRRLLFNAGHEVVGLKRLRYGQILLGDVEEGDIRNITDEEEAWLEKFI